MARTGWGWLALLATLASGWLLVEYHDRSWWGPDDGNYAHVAERVLDGEVLNRDVQDIHAGYINFVNAGSLAVFGRRMVSLRYPLIVIGVLQAIVVVALLRDRGMLTALAGAVGATALGTIQFFNPTPHWYSLFLTVVLIAWLRWRSPTARWRLEGVGFIVMTIFLFRQLSGVIVGLGAVCYLLLEAQGSEPRGGRWLARGLVVTMAAGLAAYLSRATTLSGWLLFGLGPLALLLITFRRVSVGNAMLASMLGRLVLGALLPVAPLLAYHARHGSIRSWIDDTVVAAVSLPQLPFVDALTPAVWLFGGVVVLGSGDPRHMISAAFWVVAPLLSLVLGIVYVGRLLREPTYRVGGRDALGILALFYAVVSVHYAIPIYLFYALPLTAVALLASVGRPGTARARSAVLLVGLLAAHAVAFNAGEPVERNPREVVEGTTRPLTAEPQLPRTGLRIERGDAELHGRLLARIDEAVPPSRSIATVPSSAELHFLSERRNPWRFFNTALGVRDSAGFEAALAALRRDPPVLVFHDTADKYNTPWSDSLMQRIRSRYELDGVEGRFLIYRERARAPEDR